MVLNVLAIFCSLYQAVVCFNEYGAMAALGWAIVTVLASADFVEKLAADKHGTR